MEQELPTLPEYITISSEIMTFVFRPEALTCSTYKMDKEVTISYNDQNVLYLVGKHHSPVPG
jgi:hypothetical protein